MTLQEIERGLADKYGERANRHEAFRTFIPRPAPARQAEDVAGAVLRDLDAKLPASFVIALSKWDMGALRIRNTTFCLKANYAACLLAYNSGRNGRWWEDRESETRPEKLLMIADGDPFISLLDIGDGAIEAYAVDAGSCSSKVVAPDLLCYLRGLATVDLMRAHDQPNGLVKALCDDLGGKVDINFWAELAGVSTVS